MPEGVPVERACDRCRERRVKCDKRHPACFRCEKLGKPCPGYDKKRKFVDESASLRKRFETEGGRDNIHSNLAQFSINSPTSTTGGASSKASPSATDATIARQKKPDPAPASQGTQGNGLRAIQPKSGENAQLFKPDPMLMPNDDQLMSEIPPSGASMDIDSMLNDVLDTSQFDPAWFDLEPDSFYGKNNNSCGFIPNLPNIVDEVDKNDFRPSIENFSTPMSGSNNAESNLWAPESQFHTSQIITDEREHEMAFLIRHFTESIGPWMDLFDCDKHFGQLVPLKALRDALLKNAIAAVAAKQLGRVKGNNSFVGNQHQRPATMEVIDDSSEIDWFYKAANYYDKAIMYSRMYLQALSGSLSNPPSPGLASTLSTANSDDLLLAVSIFSLYESLDNVEAGWIQHLTGMKSLLSVLGPTQINPINPLSATVARRASLWNFARADLQAAYINQTPTLLDTEDISMWLSCGLQVSNTGTLYMDPDGLKSDPGHLCATVELVAHTLLWILLRTMNYINTPTLAPEARQALWSQLTSQLDLWYSCLPAVFQPCAQLRHPVSRRQPANKTSAGSGISELFFSIPLCAATIQLYHFARILLLHHSPTTPSTSTSRLQAYREVSSQALRHAYEIVGIALARPHPAVRVESLLPLFVAGACLESDDERRVVVEVLRAIELDTGCSTDGRVRELVKEWGWEDGVGSLLGQQEAWTVGGSGNVMIGTMA